MTSGGNNFSYFPENQLTKFSAVLQFNVLIFPLKLKGKLCPPNFLVFAPTEDFCDAFCVAGGAFGRPCVTYVLLHVMTGV